MQHVMDRDGRNDTGWHTRLTPATLRSSDGCPEERRPVSVACVSLPRSALPSLPSPGAFFPLAVIELPRAIVLARSASPCS